MDRYKEHIKEFVQFMRQKGYTGIFLLELNKSRKQLTGDLAQVLELLQTHQVSQQKPIGEFSINTFATYQSDHHIKSKFVMAYDVQRGFLVNEQYLSHNAHRPERFRFNSNHEVIGRQAVVGRYPKPKPWDDILKGKFRRPLR